MRIIFVGNRLSPHVTRPLEALHRAGHKVILLDTCAVPNGKSQASVRMIPRPSQNKEIPGLLKSIAKNFKPDLVHVHWVDHVALCCLEADVAPLVVSVWGSDVNKPVCLDAGSVPCYAGERASAPFDYSVLYDLLPRVASIIVDDPVMIHKCRLLSGEDVPIHNIHLGVDRDFFSPVDNQTIRTVRKNLGLQEDQHLFVSMRIFRPHYRHEEVLEAFASLNNKNTALAFKLFYAQEMLSDIIVDPLKIDGSATFLDASGSYKRTKDPQFALVAEYEKRIRLKAEKYGVSQRVLFFNMIDASLMPTLYGLADTVINFPEQDGFPVCFTEAAACGTRVLTNMHPAYKNSFAEKCFDIVEGDTPQSLAEGMRDVLMTPYAMEKQSLARSIALTSYSFDGYMNKLLCIYNNILTGKLQSHELSIEKINKEPELSILIPCHNYSHFLKDCLLSLISQSFTDWEAIVVDDGSSTDEARTIVNGLNDSRLYYIRFEKNQGKGKALNTAFKASSGKNVMILDADDKLAPAFCEACLQPLREKVESDVVFANIQLFGNATEVWKYKIKQPLVITAEQWIPGAGSVMRRSVYSDAGGHYEGPELRHGNIDWDFWLSASRRKLCAVNIPESLYFYRIHGSSISDRRPRHDYITRECMYRRHAALFSLAGTGKPFLADGYINSAKQAWGKHEILRCAIFSARAYQLLNPGMPKLPSLDMPQEKRNHLRALLAVSLNHEQESGTEPTKESINDRIVFALLHAEMNNITLAKHHIEIALGKLIGLSDWSSVLAGAIMLAIVSIESKDWVFAEKVLEFARTISSVHPDVESLRLACALNRNSFGCGVQIAYSYMEAANASESAVLLLGRIFIEAVGDFDTSFPIFFKCLTTPPKPDFQQSHAVGSDIVTKLYNTEFGRTMYWAHRANDLFATYKNSVGGVSSLISVCTALKPKRILEVGCGNGRLLAIMAELPAVEVVGQDISATAISFSQKRCLKNVKLHQCDILDLPYQEQYFDLVICNRVLQCIPPSEIEEFISRLAKLGKNVYINELLKEDPNARESFYQFLHNYDALFERAGMKQIGVYYPQDSKAFLYSFV